MKRLLLILAAIAIMATATAQNTYDKQHHYDAASNLEIGLSAQYLHELPGSLHNWGADLRIYKRIGTHARLRGLVNVNGFLANGFDRDATALVGLSADFLPFYVFADGGLSYNPSARQRINPAADAGVGLHFDIGRNLRMFTEAGANISLNGLNTYHGNGFVKFGYTYSTGITPNDRQEISIKQHSQQLLTELAAENKDMRQENERLRAENTQYQSTLEKATAAIEQTQQLLQECKTAAASVPEATASDFRVFFLYATSELDEIELDRLWQQARVMMDDGAEYRIQGYSSPDGDLYRNEQLAKERARHVYDILKSWGIHEDRLVPTGEGISSIYPDDSPLNRMVRITKIIR